jgi:gliding motility-associated-like protein
MPIDGSDYAYARLSTTGGNHTIRSNDGFIAYVYGFGYNESFGYATGASLGNLNIDFLVHDQNPATPIDSLCLNSLIFFTPVVDTIYKYFEYDFGDGHHFFSDKDTTVFHQYATPGEYLVSVTASTGNDDCSNGNEETSRKIIRVVEPKVIISGPRSVCPNTTDVAYFIHQNFDHQIQWFVHGGNIASQSSDSLVVNWLGTNPLAAVRAVVTNRYGCESDTIEFPVKINVRLDPEAPFGPDTLCADNITDIPYFTFFTNASTYEWETDFGLINSGNGSSKITVDWENYGLGRLWFTQISVTDTVCDGVSDTLLVYIQRNPSLVGRIMTPADTFLLGESITFSLEVDTLYQFANWSFDDGRTADTLNATTELLHTFQCDGWHTIYAIAYDTGTVCSDTKLLLEKEVFVMAPAVEVTSVSNSREMENTLEINFVLRNNDFNTKNISLYRRIAGDNSWSLVTTLHPSQTSYADQNLEVAGKSYEYKIETNQDCENKISSEIHRSILLESAQDDKEAVISWNEYNGWENGIDRYEIWVSVDSGTYSLLQTSSALNMTYSDVNKGFDHCFEIRAFENGGNKAISVSNTSCVAFVPEINTYNIITPGNDDDLNEYFTIDNIEHYPNSRLVVVNRYGRTIYETVGYRNNWNGSVNGKRAPSGTYYYELELNEPRNEIKSVRGYFSILY